MAGFGHVSAAEVERQRLTKRNAKMLQLLYRTFVLLDNKAIDDEPRHSVYASEFDRKVIVANYRAELELQKTIELIKREHDENIRTMDFAKRQVLRKQQMMKERPKSAKEMLSTIIVRKKEVPQVKVEEEPKTVRPRYRPRSVPVGKMAERSVSFSTPPNSYMRSLSAFERRLKQGTVTRTSTPRQRRSMAKVPSTALET